MKRILVLSLVLAGVVWLAACAAPAPQGGPAPAPTATPVAAQGEALPFEVCGESATWTRPTDGEQKAKWWDNGRYAGTDQKVIQYPWTHDFFVAYGNASSEYDVINLSGLWTLAGDERAKCIEPATQDAILRLHKAEVWVLLHQVKSVRHVGTDYYVLVEPAGKGVQFVQFARPEQQVPLVLHFVSESGREIEKIVEAESPYWPYSQLVPTHQP